MLCYVMLCYVTTHEWGRLVGSRGSARNAEQQATPLLRGGASNHGSWRKTVVNFHSTTII